MSPLPDMQGDNGMAARQAIQSCGSKNIPPSKTIHIAGRSQVELQRWSFLGGCKGKLRTYTDELYRFFARIYK